VAEWLYEDGIGEARAALVEDGRILEAAVEPWGTLKIGTVLTARLGEPLPGGRARLTLDDGGDAVLDRPPAGTGQGRRLTVHILREAITEPGGRRKPARATLSDEAPSPGPTLRDRIAATGHPVRLLRAHEPDHLEQAGWSEVWEEARTGDVDFPGGTLRIWPTPAMTLIDVDGGGTGDVLAVAAARAAGEAIRRLGIGGSIGIDFPTLGSKAARQEAAAALDEALPQPFERTAVNGFGFLQVIRPRPRPSLCERAIGDPVVRDALAALRHAERSPPGRAPHLSVPAAVAERIGSRPDWQAELLRRTGISPIWDRT